MSPLLAQNAVQTTFEFEVYHLFVEAYEGDTLKVSDWWTKTLERCPRLLRRLRSKIDQKSAARIERLMWPPLQRTLPLASWYDLLKPYIDEHEKWLTGLGADYGNLAIRRGPTIILTETPLEGGYLSSVGADLAIMSLASWKDYAPPSVLEYALMSVQRAALRMAIDLRIGSHYPTRGCVWDFTAHQPDTRLSITVGSLCDACRSFVKERTTEEELSDIDRLVCHNWIGKSADEGSVAGNLKRIFGYDLARTQGLRTGFFTAFRNAVPSEAAKAIIGGLALLASFLLGIWWNSPQRPQPPHPVSVSAQPAPVSHR